MLRIISESRLKITVLDNGLNWHKLITSSGFVYLNSMKTAVVMGTRPEIIKLAPVINQLRKKDSTLIFSGQHYDHLMGMDLIEQLKLRRPDYSLLISKSVPAVQMGEIMIRLSKILDETKPDTVIVQGDTNTVMASAVTSLKSKVPVSHVESGLRSFDWRMPEEHNRICVDHVSDLLFAPTKTSRNNLLAECVHGRIHVTGNTVIDSVERYARISRAKSTLDIGIDNYALLTLHRSENVDDDVSLSSIIGALLGCKQCFVFPVHPRTKKRLVQLGLLEKMERAKNFTLLDPAGYFDMLELMKRSSFVVTDSGGIQEEVTAPSIRKKAVVIRKTTDRPESIASGYALMAGTSPPQIQKSITNVANLPSLRTRRTPPYGRGGASEKIISILKDRF